MFHALTSRDSIASRPSRDRAVRAIIRAWRQLTGGTSRRIPDADRRTLIACSGGADSSALALALAMASAELALAHVVHDLRSPEEAGADRDRVAVLAARLGLPFVEASVSVAGRIGNTEANARHARYTALADMASRHACRFVAVAHHADDELETVLMGLLRGAGPRGLSGLARTRPLGDSMLIRPMLDVTRADAQRICRAAAWDWGVDATNDDTARFRAGIRHTVAPLLETIRPGAARRVARSAALLRDAAGLVDDRVDLLWSHGAIEPDSLAWNRDLLSQERPIVIGALLRRTCRHLRGATGGDRAGWRHIGPAVEAVGDARTDPRRFTLAGIQVVVDVREVRVERSLMDGK